MDTTFAVTDRFVAEAGDTVTLNEPVPPSCIVRDEGLIVIDVTSVVDEPELLTVTLTLKETPSLLEKVRVSEPTAVPVILIDFVEIETEQYFPPLDKDGRVPVVALDGE